MPAADAAVFISNRSKTLLANGWIAFFIIGIPTFDNSSRRFPRNLLDCIVLNARLFDNLKRLTKSLEKT